MSTIYKIAGELLNENLIQNGSPSLELDNDSDAKQLVDNDNLDNQSDCI